MTNHRHGKDNSADEAELAEIDSEAQEIDKRRRFLTQRRRLVTDRMRKRQQAAA